GPAELVARQQHRRALRQEHRGEQGALQTEPGGVDRWIGGRAFDTPVGRVVIGVAVLVVLAVGLVVALGVAHRVAQGEAVVARHVVDRGPGPSPAMLEDVARAREPRGELRALALVAAPEATHAVAEAVVPFGEARGVFAELVAARPGIPWLGDQLDPRQDGVLADRVEEARSRIEAVTLAAERRA